MAAVAQRDARQFPTSRGCYAKNKKLRAYAQGRAAAAPYNSHKRVSMDNCTLSPPAPGAQTGVSLQGGELRFLLCSFSTPTPCATKRLARSRGPVRRHDTEAPARQLGLLLRRQILPPRCPLCCSRPAASLRHSRAGADPILGQARQGSDTRARPARNMPRCAVLSTAVAIALQA